MLSELMKRLGPDTSSGSQSPNDVDSKTKSSNNNTPPKRPTELIPKSEGTGLGPLILKKRRSKMRMKGTAPQVSVSCISFQHLWLL